MPQSVPMSIEILSDEEDEEPNGNNVVASVLSTPLAAAPSKRPRFQPGANPSTVLVIDDDPTPQKPRVTSKTSPLVIPETPMSILVSNPTEVSIVEPNKVASKPQVKDSSADKKFSGISGMISLESDSESERLSEKETWKENDSMNFGYDSIKDSGLSTSYVESCYPLGSVNSSKMSGSSSLNPSSSQHDLSQDIQVHDHSDNYSLRLEEMDNTLTQNSTLEVDVEKENKIDKATGKNRLSKEERMLQMQERKLKKKQEKLQKAALKVEAAKMKKLVKEKEKWEKGKLALKSIVAEIDTGVVELGSVGGHLLSRFSEKGLTFRITSNPIERSIVWTMTVPEEISQLSSSKIEIPYLLLVYEAKDFCDIVVNESFMDHVSSTRSRYPSHTVCYLTNRLLTYINKREQAHYKNPSKSNGWSRPPVEEAVAKLATHFCGVHSMQCRDEAEVAEHVVGLTRSLAECQFRLKALIAIPKVQPRFAIAIWKKYPTMKSLLSVYMDPSKSVHEKEFHLKDLATKGVCGEDIRLGEICSKRVYRVLMAQSGSMKTDDVEDGADFFVR